MAENADQMLLRVEMMADDTRGVKWDLSPNDIAALRHVLATLTAAESAVARLTAERDEAQALVVDQRGLLLTMKGERDAAREQLAAQTPVIAAIEQGRCESLPEFVAYARRKALREEANDAAKSYRLALALALSIPVSNITVESAQAWIDDWKARNG